MLSDVNIFLVVVVVPKLLTYFCVRLTDSMTSNFVNKFFLTPMLQPGIKPTSVSRVASNTQDLLKEPLPTELHGRSPTIIIKDAIISLLTMTSINVHFYAA